MAGSNDDADMAEITANDDHHGNAFRRPHKKSRFGCRNCKQRRIKCDEARPQCANCIRRKVRCDFLPPEPPATDAKVAKLALPPAVASSSADDQDLYIVSDLELMHNWSTETSAVLCNDPNDPFWAKTVPQAAFRHPPIMHLVLSLSAIHLRRSDPGSRRSGYLMFQSQGHASKAQAILTNHPYGRIPAEDRLMTAILLQLHTMLQGPKEGHYFAFYDDDGAPPGFLNLTTARQLVQSLESTPGATDTTIAPPRSADSLDPDKRPANVNGLTQEIFDFKLHFFRLMKFIESLRAEDPSLQMYVEAFSQLHVAFRAFYSYCAPQMTPREQFIHVMRWLLEVSDAFINALRARRPMALVIFAHYAMLLYHFEDSFIIGQWPIHILNGIHNHLHPNYREWTNWPREKTNFQAPRNEEQWPLFPHRPPESHFEQFPRAERTSSPGVEN